MRAPIRAARFLARGQKALVAARCGVTRTRQLVRTCGARVCRLGLKMVETTVIEAPAPSDEKKKSSNLLASAGVNFERRYRSNQTAQNYHVGQSEVVYEDEDGREHRMEIVKVSEKIGNFRKCVPRLSVVCAWLLCLVNVVLPGIGTLVATFRVLCGVETSNPNRSQAVCYGFLAAFLQILLAPIIIGWVWSILYGVYLVQDAGGLAPEQPGDPSP